MALATPIAPVQRVGRVFQYTIQTGNALQFPIALVAAVNAFYVVDSPYPLAIRTDISGQTSYQAGTGESFGQMLGHVTILGFATASGVVTTAPGGVAINLKIWVGTDTHIGFIDHRAPVAGSVVYQGFTSAGSVTGYFVIAGNNVPLVVSAPTGNRVLTGFVVSNASAAISFLTDGTNAPNAGGQYLVAFPANSITTLNWLPQGLDPVAGGTLFFTGNVNLAIATLTQNSGFYLEGTP